MLGILGKIALNSSGAVLIAMVSQRNLKKMLLSNFSCLGTSVSEALVLPEEMLRQKWMVTLGTLWHFAWLWSHSPLSWEKAADEESDTFTERVKMKGEGTGEPGDLECPGSVIEVKMQQLCCIQIRTLADILC